MRCDPEIKTRRGMSRPGERNSSDLNYAVSIAFGSRQALFWMPRDFFRAASDMRGSRGWIAFSAPALQAAVMAIASLLASILWVAAIVFFAVLIYYVVRSYSAPAMDATKAAGTKDEIPSDR
jgi:hypothetical protein